MVSLRRSTNSPSGGATFFGESGNMEEREYLQPILEAYGIFKPLKTIFPFSIHLLATLGIQVAAIVFVSKHASASNGCNEYFALIYAHVALWFLTLLVHLLAKKEHYNLRLNGYLDFYRKTNAHHQLPFYIVSLWIATLLHVQVIMQNNYPTDFVDRCIKGGVYAPISYIFAFTTVEFLVIAVIDISYILKVRRFNKTKSPPDVQKEEWAACSSPENFAQGEVGYRQMGDKVYDFIEKQADLIRHLKDHNARLGEKLMILNAQMQARTSQTASGTAETT